MIFLKNKLVSDIAWTVGSFIILAMSGMVLNLIIIFFYNAATLGTFNLTYTIYIISSQLATLGCHYSVIRHSAHHISERHTRDIILINAIVIGIFLGVIGFIILYSLSKNLGDLFSNQQLGLLVANASTGLILFPLNKILLAYLNSLRLMKYYSFLQALRYLLVMAFIGFVCILRMPFKMTTISFIASETILTITAIIFLYRLQLLPKSRFDYQWIKNHITFGIKSFPAGIFVEMNSRIDILMMGIYCHTELVGIYSFSATLVDGLYHILSMVRINFNPILVAAVRDKKWHDVQNLLNQSKRFLLPITILLSLAILSSFWLLANIFMPTKGLQPGVLPLSILLTGLTTIAMFVPFDNILLMSGYPVALTLQHCSVLFANIGLGIILIPKYGMVGAAFAVVTGYFSGFIALQFLANHLLGWNLLKNRVQD
ncbi:MAG: polysaccharide biosynthesis C-terminal domain-containing protein [Candidatus Symbiodolus clandestinus]